MSSEGFARLRLAQDAREPCRAGRLEQNRYSCRQVYQAVDLDGNRPRFFKRNVRQLRYSCKPIVLEPSGERLVLTNRERHPV